MKNLNQLLRQAQEMQEKMAQMQQKMGEVTVEGASGGGMVKITFSCKGEVQGVKIDPSLLNKEEGEILEDLIVAACRDAKDKADAYTSQEMQKLTGGMNLPAGMKLPF
jgi:hypothetical protein